MMLAVSHLWLRTAPMSGEEGPSPVKSFLEPLNFRRRTGALLKEQGFDDVPGVDAPGSGLLPCYHFIPPGLTPWH